MMSLVRSLFYFFLLTILLSACSTPMQRDASKSVPSLPAEPATTRSAPPAPTPKAPISETPPTASTTPVAPQTSSPLPQEAQSSEALLRRNPAANKTYTVSGARYSPVSPDSNYEATGWVSWYGAMHHGQKTASGEIYDMNAFTAAHTVLPIPSYALVTNPANGTQAIVRINDRGPFLEKRVMDVSQAAAKQLGFLSSGLAKLKVRSLSTKEALDWLRAGALQPGAGGAANLSVLNTTNATNANNATGASKPTTTVATASATAAPSQSDVPTGYYAQLGAYKDNAAALVLAQRADQSARDLKLGSPLAPNQPLVQLMAIDVASGRVSRVLAGPYASREEALKTGQLLGTKLSVSATLYQQK